jgi:hypothetical protein
LGGKGGEGDEQGGEGAGDGNRTAPFPSVKSFSADMVAMDPYISTLFFLTVEDELLFLAPFPTFRDCPVRHLSSRSRALFLLK